MSGIEPSTNSMKSKIVFLLNLASSPYLVLARTPNAPEGIKGISLFLVPKIIPTNNGTLDVKNNVKCGSIEKKNGY